MAIEGALKTQLQKEFNLDSESGYTRYVASSFHLGNLLFILPAAYLLQRYSVRRITLGAFFIAISSALMMSYINIAVFVLARFFFGAAHAFCFLCLSTLISRWFSPNKQGLATGVAVAIGLSGLMICQHANHFLHGYLGLGLGYTILFFACFGIIAWIFAYVYIQDYPEGEKIELQQNPFAYLKEAMSNRKNWAFAAFAAFMNAPFMVYLLHLQDFLTNVHGLESTKAGIMFTWISLGNIVGNPLMGLLSEKWQSRRGPMLLASITTLALLILLFYLPASSLLIGAVLFLLGVMISAQVLSYPSIATANPPHMVSSAMSIASLVVMGSITPFQTLTAHLLDYCSNCTKGYLYTPNDYWFSFSPFFIAVTISIVIALLIKDPLEKVTNQEKAPSS